MKLLVADLSLPFSGIENDVAFQTRDSVPDTIPISITLGISRRMASRPRKMPLGVIRTPFSLKNAAMAATSLRLDRITKCGFNVRSFCPITAV